MLIWKAACAEAYTVPYTLISIVFLNRLRSRIPFELKVKLAVATPAQLTRICKAPNHSIALCTDSLTAVSLVISKCKNIELAPSYSTAFYPSSSFLSAIATLHPAS